MNQEILEKTTPAVQSKGARTRERILDLAYRAIIQKGFAATSIEELVAAAGITKSGFFYHFRDKNDLARQILERYQTENNAFQDELIAQARDLSDDPLHSFLIFLKLYAEAMVNSIENHPGCLVATITFQDQAFDRSVAQMNVDDLRAWRQRYLAWLEEIAETYPPRAGADLVALADGVFGVTASALTMAIALGEPEIMRRQILLYRDQVRSVFSR
ncbi:MAG: TetR/AcrR family transcriptional regulator [Phenylobacterium sp.]|uniref:TetR/AcrR family transcriptional regulator n=1 Tax=Phenylobacterium sp. TaxID=1871053 RepID=UPI00391DC74C